MSKTVLAVDDSASMRQLVRFTLDNAGYNVLEAADGHDALQKLTTEPVDFVVTDLNMPNMDGIDLIRQIRANPNHRYLPILMVTTESQADRKVAGKEAGATGWIVKPFHCDQLVALVNRLMR